MSKPISGPGPQVHGPGPNVRSQPSSIQAPAAQETQQRSATHMEDGTWADAQVTLSDEPSATRGPGNGRGKAHGKSEADGEFKNHGQMVSAAAHAGIHGKDLAAIAKGDTTVDKAALTAIGNGDVTLSQYQAAQKQVADGSLTTAQLSAALKLMAEKDMTWDAALAEAKKPAEKPAADAVAEKPVEVATTTHDHDHE